MFTVATRARTLLAPGFLATASAVTAAFLWSLPLWDRIGERADDTDLAGSMTLTVTAVILAANAVRERRDRAERVRNLAAIMPALQFTPRGGGGQGQPQQAAHWYRYLQRSA